MISFFNFNQLSLYEILNSLFNKNIIKIRYLGYNQLKSVKEYKFFLLKFNVLLENYSNYTIFIKLINENQVEESLFCYGLFCQEKYNNRTKNSIPKANIINYNKNNYEKRYQFQLLKKDNKIWEKSFIDIININEYNKKRNKLVKTNKFLFVAVL